MSLKEYDSGLLQEDGEGDTIPLPDVTAITSRSRRQPGRAILHRVGDRQDRWKQQVRRRKLLKFTSILMMG